MTFKEFKASGRPVDDLRNEPDLGGQVEHHSPVPGIVYADGIGYLMRVGDGPQYELIISNLNWCGSDVQRLEEILWATWYLPEEPNRESITLKGDDLDAFVRGMCASYNRQVDGDLWGVIFSGQDEFTLDEASQLMHEQFDTPAHPVALSEIDQLKAEIKRLNGIIARVCAIVSEA